MDSENPGDHLGRAVRVRISVASGQLLSYRELRPMPREDWMMPESYHQLGQPLGDWTDDDIKFLTGLIRTVVASEVGKAVRDVADHSCRFTVTDEQADQMSHMMGVYHDLGDSDIARGIECIRKNHEWIQKVRQRSDKASGLFFVIMTTAVITGMIGVFWAGVRSFLVKLLG